jgi:hypothetical protein
VTASALARIQPPEHLAIAQRIRARPDLEPPAGWIERAVARWGIRSLTPA